MRAKGKSKSGDTITINRAPVLTLWAAIVAERLGFDWDESMTLGRAVAGLNAYSKGVSLGLFQPRPKKLREKTSALKRGGTIRVDLLHRAVICKRTSDGIRALSKDRVISPESVQRYLETKFGDSLGATTAAMRDLAGALRADDLAQEAYGLYEAFRPTVPGGQRGWGAAGVLDLSRVRALSKDR